MLDVTSKGTDMRKNVVEDKALSNAISARADRGQPKRDQPQKKVSNAIVK